jgi:hypothetical protein
VAKILDIVVGNVKEKGMMCTLPVIDALVQVCQFLGDLTLLVHLSLLTSNLNPLCFLNSFHIFSYHLHFIFCSDFLLFTV